MRRPPNVTPEHSGSSKPNVSLADEMARLLAEHSGEAFVTESDDNPFGWIDILTFCENPYYLGEKLYPWQRLIMKIFYMGSPGNSNLFIMDNPNPSCSNCVWNGNDLNRVGRNPCMVCTIYDESLREMDRSEIRKNAVLRRERKEMLLNPVEYKLNFCNEIMLINNNLPSDSDARSGGSVAKQVLGKIGKAFSELFLVLGRRSGKALALDTPIITTDGWSTMGDLSVGDRVFGSDGKPTTIVAATEVMKDRPCYKMTFSNGEVIICDEQHEWPTIDKLERKYSVRYGRDPVCKSRTTKEIAETIYYGNQKEYNHSINMCSLITEGKRKSDIGRIFIESVERIDAVPVRCIQVDNEDHTYLAGNTCIPTHNSQMACWIALYEIYKLIEMGNPQHLLGLSEGSLVTVLNVAVAEEQAQNAIFSKVRSAIEKSPYFKTKMVPKSMRVSSVKFLTPHDEERNKELEREGFPAREGSIQFISGHSNSSSQVGLNIPVIIIDEMSQMGKVSGSSTSDSELYTQLRNSVWNFPDYKIICISNPLTRDGKFYELYEASFTDDRFLMFQLPSYIVNPAIPDEVLEEERKQAMSQGGMAGYQMQIEARFIGGTADPLIPALLIDEAFERGYRLVRTEQGDPRQSYYLHIDPALSDDNYALAVVHVETDPLRRSDSGDVERIIFVDHIQMWSPDRISGTPIDIATVEQYVFELCNRFHIVSVTSDQWGSWSSMQNFQRRGLPARVTPFNPNYVNQIFTNMVELFVQGRIVFYQHGPFSAEAMEQWKYLQQKFSRRNTRVEAAEGHKDDIPAAIAGASYVAISGAMSYAGLPESILVNADWGRSSSITGGFGGQQNMGWRR